MSMEQSAVPLTDLLKIEREATVKIRDEVRITLEDIRTTLEEIKKDRQDLHNLIALFREVIAEYDRLGQQESTHIRALMQTLQAVKSRQE